MEHGTTLLGLVLELHGDEEAVVRALDSGSVRLTGNFRGKEREIVTQWIAAAEERPTGALAGQLRSSEAPLVPVL